MICALIAGMVLRSTGFEPIEELVFSASKYVEHLGNVVRLGPHHLYSVRTDGTHVRQITYGESSDLFPSRSKLNNRIWFWRQPERSALSDRFTLYSVAFSGANLRRTATTASYPTPGLAQAIERFGAKIVRSTYTRDGGGISVVSPTGVELVSNADLVFNPRSDGAIAFGGSSENSDDRDRIIDLLTMKTYIIPRDCKRLFWVDNDTVGAVIQNQQSQLLLLNPKGQRLKRIKFTDLPSPDPSENNPADLFDVRATTGQPEVRSICTPQRGRLFVECHFGGSAGGYSFYCRLDLSKHRISKPLGMVVEAISSDGRLLLDSESDWIGGYKGAGAAKLTKLDLVDERSGRKQPIGFKYMEWGGAVFVSRSKP